MIQFLKKHYQLILIYILTFWMFFGSLFVFFTNDDFFFLRISKVNTVADFISFFSITKAPEGFGMYRPLTTQLFYFLSWKFFNLSPLGLHIISFLVFLTIIWLVYKFATDIFSNHLTGPGAKKLGIISAFLYATSATHFAHLYYLATFQELGMTLLVLLSCLNFLYYLRKNNGRNYILSIVFFILALASKETAVIAPILFILIYWFEKANKSSVLNWKRFIVSQIPYFIILSSYLLIRFNFYGFAKGDTYIWDFSLRKLINTFFWYTLWSLNIPETILDFVGPGLKLNPNLYLYWSKQIIPIFILFVLELLGIAYFLIRAILNRNKKFIIENNSTSVFCAGWFVAALSPVAFLPLHKFTFYLTLPLIGFVIRIAYVFVKTKIRNFFIIIFLIIWTTLSILTIKHTVNTDWITKGEEISERTYNFVNKNYSEIGKRDIVFADTVNDFTLPWSPTDVVRVALSGENFFKVFYPDFKGNVYYGASRDTTNENSYIILSRTLLGY